MKNGLLTCLLADECLQIEIDKDLEGEYLWRHKEDILLIIEKKEELWLHPSYLIIPPQSLKTGLLYNGKTKNGEQFFLFFEWMEIATCTYASYHFPTSKILQIGRGQCDIRYDNEYVSNVHAQMLMKDNQLFLIDMDSRNGVYVNHKRCRKQQLFLGDCIYIMGLQIIIGTDCFAINQIDLNVSISNCPFYCKKPYGHITPHPAMRIYPFHAQTTSFLLPTIQIQNPPTSLHQEKMPFIYTLGPSMTMGVAALTSAFFSLQNATQNQQPLSSVLPTVMMSFSMVASTMLWPVLLRRYEQHRDVQHEEKRKRDYQLYLRKNQHQIQELLNQYKAYLHTMYHINIESYIQEKQHLYQFQMAKEDALTLCIGVGTKDIKYPFSQQDTTMTLIEDELLQAKDNFINQPCILENVPIYENLFEHSLWYVEGRKEHTLAYAMYLILQLCATYTPAQIQVVIAYEDSESLIDLLRYIPHIFDEKQRRYLCHNVQQAQQVSMFIHQSERPTIVFSCSERLSEAMHVLQLCELPLVSAFLFHEVVAYVSFPHKTLRVLKNEVIDDANRKSKWKPIFDIYGVNEILANINIPSFNELDFPTMYSFLQMFQVQSVEQLHVYTRWLQSDTSRSLAIPLGVNAANEHVLLDIHEKAHGPHGIIAGMTGSGKSELLITMILSMAVNFHPDDVSFILIDYKGGGMAKTLESIPHIAGIITNLDGNMIQRSLNSLDSELLRRQKIFIEKAKQLQIPSIDIYAYQRLYHQQVVEEALPHLLIVADEFAELKQQQPEFMEQLIRAARIGRSLGIHLLLATQKPSGVVDDQIWSNARFHICLKVQEKADSMDMLKRDDGAKLNDTGRFYLQVGYNELFEEGQSAYAKMQYICDRNVQRESPQIEQIDALGAVLAKGKKTQSTKRYASELEMIISTLKRTAQLHQVKAHQVWMPPLPDHIALQKENKTMIALVDDPLKQCQFPLCITQELQMHMLLFAMNLQESLTLLKAILYQLCTMYSTMQLRILFFDFAPIRFQEASQIPHVYSYVQGDDEEDIQFLKGYIEKELQDRKAHKKKQRLYICIHHLIAFLEVYEDWETLLHLLARDGEQYGITLLLTATSANDVRYRLLQQITCFFVFQLRDTSEYSTLLGKALHPLHQEGRAYWKSENIYEVQCVDATIPLQEFMEREKHQKIERLATLPQHLSSEAIAPFYDKKEPLRVPIGILKDVRTPYFMDLNYIWIVSGSGMKQLRKVLENCDYTNDIECVVMRQCDKDNMQQIVDARKRKYYVIEPNLLCEYSCASWIQEHQKEIKLLWVGTGIETIRYVFNIPMKYQELYPQDAYEIGSQIHVVRIMENI